MYIWKEEHTIYIYMHMHGPFHFCVQPMCADHLRSSFISFSETQTSSIVTLFDDFFLITTSMRAKNSSCNTGMAIKLFFEQDLEAKQYCADFYGFNKPNNPWTNCNPSRAEPSGSCQKSCRLLAARLEHLNKFFSFWLGTTFGSAA